MIYKLNRIFADLKIKSLFKNWTKLEIAWLLIANLSILGISLYWGDNPLAIISSLTGVTCVILVAKRMSLNYWFGAIQVATYAYLSLDARLYGEVMLNAFYYFPMQFFGLYMWRKASNGNTCEIKSKNLSWTGRCLLTIIASLSIWGYSLGLEAINGSIPVIDATSTILSVMAMILMVCQYTEQWVLWIIINVVSIIMWAISIKNGTGDIATLLMWVVFLINSIFGLVSWMKSDKESK